MGRHNHKERVGFHFIGHTIEDEFNWAFRGQSIADVGIDAIVEQCINGDPTGRLLALQIKSGEGNVYENETSFTYYISNIHYYYWLSFDIPVVLTLYIKKKKKKIFWINIIKNNIKKTKTKWKIEIPKTNLLNENSLSLFTKIVEKGKNKILLRNRSTEDDLLEKIGNIAALSQVTNSLKFMTFSIELFHNEIIRFGTELEHLVNNPNTTEVKFLIYKMERELQYVLETLGSRTYSEIQIFAQLFSDTMIGLKTKFQLFESNQEEGIREQISNELKELEKLNIAFNSPINGIASMQKSIEKFKTNRTLKNHRSAEIAIVACNQIIEEIQLGQELLNQIKDEYK